MLIMLNYYAQQLLQCQFEQKQEGAEIVVFLL